MNIMSLTGLLGGFKSGAVGEGRLVAMARVLSLLWVPQLSPPGAEL